MSTKRITFMAITLLLASSGKGLTASQAQSSSQSSAQPVQSLFSERQTNVTVVNATRAELAATSQTTAFATVAATTTPYTGGSTSSASTRSSCSTSSGSQMSEQERNQIALYQAQEYESGANEEESKKAYNAKWLKQPGLSFQQKAFHKIDKLYAEVGLPRDLALITSQYVYEFQGTCTQTLADTEDADRVTTLVVLPNGQLASGSYDKSINIWSPITGKCTQTIITGHTGCITALAVLPNGQLASGSEDNTIKIWSKGQTAWKCTQTLTEHTDSIGSLAILPNGQLASGSGAFDGTIRIWSPITEAKGQTTWKCTQPLTEHLDPIGWPAMLPNGQIAFHHVNYIKALAVLPSGQLVSASGDGTINIWSLETNDNGKTYSWRCTCTQNLSEYPETIGSLAVLPNGKLASGASDGTIKIWSLETNDNGKTYSWRCTQTLREHEEPISSFAILPDGQLASASDDGTINIWE